MRIYQVALREVARRKIRTLYTASGITVAVALLVATLTVGGAAHHDLQQTIARYGHSLTIFPSTTHETSLQGFGIGSGHYIPQDLIPEIKRVYDAAIRAGWQRKGGLLLAEGAPGGLDLIEDPIIAPRLYEPAQVLGRDVIVAGVEASEEYKARFWWEIDEGALPAAADEFMAGKVLADVARLRPGQRLVINGHAVKLTGILRETDSPDDYMLFGALSTVQRIFDRPNKISLINIRAMCNYCPVGEAELWLNQQVVGVRATSQREIAQAQHRIFANVVSVIGGFVAVSLAIACMAVFNMMMGTIHGRIREVGLLKVLGASRWQLLRLFMYESIGIGLVGGALGAGLGIVIAQLVGPWLLPSAIIQVRLSHVGLALAAAVLTSVLATLYPAIHAGRIKPAQAFRAL